ncbi:MAG: S53 family peptidase [Tepidisphaeraceae bacterium]
MASENKNDRIAAVVRRVAMEVLEPRTLFSSAVTVLTPAEVRSAYGFSQVYFTVGGTKTGAWGAGQKIAIVDAYGDPTISSDLKSFDAAIDLGNGDAAGNFVLSVATPEGTPATNGGWALEQSLDVEWAHVIAPQADIVLVEARSSSFTDLMNAVNYASSLTGVVAVSMSWGGSEFSGEQSYDSYFTTPAGHLDSSGLAGGIVFVAASGDNSVPSYPATSTNVLAVGGTVLSADGSGNYLGETAWSNSGGGISTLEQNYSPDVSYNAGTPYMVYDTTPYQRQSGWFEVGGTSAGAPQWAALVADADQGRMMLGFPSLTGSQMIGTMLGLPESDFKDITTGNNGYYAAGPGFDLVTGKGSPIAQDIISALVVEPITTNASGVAYTPALTGSVTASIIPVSTGRLPFAAASRPDTYSAVIDANPGTFSAASQLPNSLDNWQQDAWSSLDG